jgi:hypothetical protein
MNSETVGEILRENLRTYDASLATIRQCVSLFETQAEELIGELRNVDGDAAHEIFERLQVIQSALAEVSFKYNIPLGEKLNALVREFDRLDEPYIREYWHRKFAEGLEWPLSS